MSEMDTRTRILNAAFEVITRNGYAGAGIAEIIKSSGMTRGAVYHHFASKEEIGRAVVREVILERYAQYWRRAFEAAYATPAAGDRQTAAKKNGGRGASDSVLEALIAGLKNTKLLNCNNGCSLTNVHQSVNSTNDPRLAETVREAQSSFEAIFIDAIRLAVDRHEFSDPAGVDPQILGAFIAAAFQGAMGAAGVEGGPSKYLRLIGELERYLRGLANPRAGTSTGRPATPNAAAARKKSS